MTEFKIIEDDALAYDEDLCPHDGATCHHGCDAECFRESGGMALTVPCEGYPLPGHEMPEPPLSTDRLRRLKRWLDSEGAGGKHADRVWIHATVRALFEEFTNGLCLTCGGEACHCPDPFPPGDVPK